MKMYAKSGAKQMRKYYSCRLFHIDVFFSTIPAGTNRLPNGFKTSKLDFSPKNLICGEA